MKAPAISGMKGMHSPLLTKRQVYHIPQNGTTGQAYDQILEGMMSPTAESGQNSQDSCTSPKGKSPGSPSKLDKARDEPSSIGSGDSQDSCTSPTGRSPGSPSKLDKAREENEKLKNKQVQLMREKCKWQKGMETMQAIYEKMKHTKDCLDEACLDIRENNNFSQKLDNDDIQILPADHTGDHAGNKLSPTEHNCDRQHVKQGKQRNLDDNNLVRHEVQYNRISEQKSPREDSLDDDCFDKTEWCDKDSPCYTIRPGGRNDDHDLSDASDDYSRSPPSDNSEHSFNSNCSSTQNTQHNEHSPTQYTQHNAHSPTQYTQHNAHSPTQYTQNDEHSPTQYTQNNAHSPTQYIQHIEHSPTHLTHHLEHSPITEHDVTNNNSKEEDMYNWLSEILPSQQSKSIEEIKDFLKDNENNCQQSERLPSQPSKSVEEIVDVIDNKENNCQLAEMLPTQPSKSMEEIVDFLNNKQNNCQLTEIGNNRNKKLTGKRPSSSQETPIPRRRSRDLVRKEACLIRLPVANTEDVEPVLATGKEDTIEPDNSTELNTAREKLPVRELEKEGLLTDNKTNGEQLAKKTTGEEESGKTGNNTGETTQAEEVRPAKECQPNDGNVGSDSDVLNKTTVDTAKDDSSSKIEPTETSMQRAGEHNTEAAINSVGSSIVLGKDNTNVENKVKVDSVNTKYETVTDNPREEEASTDNITKDGDHKSAQCPKEVPKALGTDTSERNESKRDEVQAAQPTDAGIFIDGKPQVEVSEVDENGEEGKAPKDTRQFSTAPENPHELVETDICSLELGDLDTNILNTCDSSNRTCSGTKEVPKAVRDTKVKRALVDDDSESDCTLILERRTMHNSTPPSRGMKDLSTTDCYEERDIIIVETSKAEKAVAISFVEQNHPNKLSDAKDNEQNTEDDGCDDAKSDDNIRKRASRIDNNTEKHLKTKYNTKESDAVVDNNVDEIGIPVNIVVNKSSMNTANTTSQQNRATADEDDPGIQTTLYNTDWRGRLFFWYIPLATLLCVVLATYYHM